MLKIRKKKGIFNECVAYFDKDLNERFQIYDSLKTSENPTFRVGSKYGRIIRSDQQFLDNQRETIFMVKNITGAIPVYSNQLLASTYIPETDYVQEEEEDGTSLVRTNNKDKNDCVIV